MQYSYNRNNNIMNRIHVMQVLHTLEVGGAEKLAFDISRNFDDQFKFSFLCLDSLGELTPSVKQHGMDVFCLNRQSGFDLSLVKKFSRIIKEHHVDIIHAHQYTPYFYSVISALFTNRRPKVIFTEHGRHQPDKVRIKRVIFNRVFQPFTSLCTGVSAFSKDSLVQFEKIPASKIDLIYNGVDLKNFPIKYDKNMIREELGFNKNDILVGIIARLDPIKDHTTLLDAVSLLKKESIKLKLIIVGDGPEKSLLTDKVNLLDLKDEIVFMGTRDDVPKILLALDIFVLPSIMEAMSVTLLEAMSASLPVVATGVGGNKELIVNDISGKLVPVGDAKSLATAIKSLLTNPDSAQKLGTEARKSVEKNFSFNKMIENYKNAYLKVLGNKL